MSTFEVDGPGGARRVPDLAALEDLARRGQISRSTRVRAEGEAEWTEAGRIPALNGAFDDPWSAWDNLDTEEAAHTPPPTVPRLERAVPEVPAPAFVPAVVAPPAVEPPPAPAFAPSPAPPPVEPVGPVDLPSDAVEEATPSGKGRVIAFPSRPGGGRGRGASQLAEELPEAAVEPLLPRRPPPPRPPVPSPQEPSKELRPDTGRWVTGVIAAVVLIGVAVAVWKVDRFSQWTSPAQVRPPPTQAPRPGPSTDQYADELAVLKAKLNAGLRDTSSNETFGDALFVDLSPIVSVRSVKVEVLKWSIDEPPKPKTADIHVWLNTRGDPMTELGAVGLVVGKYIAGLELEVPGLQVSLVDEAGGTKERKLDPDLARRLFLGEIGLVQLLL